MSRGIGSTSRSTRAHAALNRPLNTAIIAGTMAASTPPEVAAHPVDEVVALLDEAATEARHQERDDLLVRLERERDRILHPVCHVLVVGEFKKGKSSLVNALLNARVCPADADRATAVPTFVRYGDEASATTLEPQSPVPVEQIESVVTGAGARPAQSLAVTVPRQLLRDGLVLVDTPGVGGGLTAAHAAVTLRALTVADVVLFVSDAGQEYSGPELDFLRRAVELCPRVVCALTKIDFYPDWRRILDIDEGHLRRAGIDAPLVPAVGAAAPPRPAYRRPDADRRVRVPVARRPAARRRHPQRRGGPGRRGRGRPQRPGPTGRADVDDPGGAARPGRLGPAPGPLGRGEATGRGTARGRRPVAAGARRPDRRPGVQRGPRPRGTAARGPQAGRRP